MGGGKRVSFPSWVWSPAGGWYPDPAAWKRNTFIAFIGMFVLAYPVFKLSSEREFRPFKPIGPVPSQYFAKQFKDDNFPNQWGAGPKDRNY